MSALRACPCCALVQRVPEVIPPRCAPRCPRCRTRLPAPGARGRAGSRAWPAAFALAALILYPVSMLLPVIEIERLGHTHAATIWTGVVELAADGQYIIAAIVFVCSILIPVLKIGGIFALCTGWSILQPRHRAVTYRAIDVIGRWGMIDVLLVAILVAAVKLGNWMDVAPGPGAVAFAAVVLLSLLASATFDPRTIWEPHPA